MFESLRARILVEVANNQEYLLIPDSRGDREIAESMFIDGAPVKDININTLKMWQERRKVKPKLVSDWQPAVRAKNGLLRPLRSR